MYRVSYKDGRRHVISNARAERAIMFKKQGMLSARQRDWMNTVKEIAKIREAPNHKLLMKTKDMVCTCDECE